MRLEDIMERTTEIGCYAARVRARTEIAISTILRGAGCEVLVPTFIDSRTYSDRIRKIPCALFPGYVFICLNKNDLSRVRTIQGVSYIVRTGTSLHPMPPDEEFTLRALCGIEGACEPCENFVAGELVSIESGPFRGLRGTLVRKVGRDRLVLSLSSIFSSVLVDRQGTIVRLCKSSMDEPRCVSASRSLARSLTV
jgi:transcription antitermination factor NusG